MVQDTDGKTGLGKSRSVFKTMQNRAQEPRIPSSQKPLDLTRPQAPFLPIPEPEIQAGHLPGTVQEAGWAPSDSTIFSPVSVQHGRPMSSQVARDILRFSPPGKSGACSGASEDGRAGLSESPWRCCRSAGKCQARRVQALGGWGSARRARRPSARRTGRCSRPYRKGCAAKAE